MTHRADRPRDNVEVFRRGAEALTRGDVDALLALATEDVVVRALRSAVEGQYQGHDGIRRFAAPG
jgi:ketosteroid isomerase-like protein